MVILFKGTDKARNLSTQALGLCVGIASTRFMRKSLVIQLITNNPVEDYVIGKKIKDQTIGLEAFSFEDTGFDSLMRRVGVSQLELSHYNNAVTPVMAGENMYDILTASKKPSEDLKNEILKYPERVIEIIESAKPIYDDIYILADGRDKEIIELVVPSVDKTVTCIGQGKKEEISAKSSDDFYYLVTDFDYKSSFATKSIIKAYGTKNVYIMPYNVEFKDYFITENMIAYILHNYKPNNDDYSYHLITEIAKFVGVLTGISEDDIEDNEFTFEKRLAALRKNAYFKTLTGSDIDIREKKKMFEGTYKEIHVVPDSEGIYTDNITNEDRAGYGVISPSEKEEKAVEKKRKEIEKKRIIEEKRAEKIRIQEERKQKKLEKFAKRNGINIPQPQNDEDIVSMNVVSIDNIRNQGQALNQYNEYGIDEIEEPIIYPNIDVNSEYDYEDEAPVVDNTYPNIPEPIEEEYEDEVTVSNVNTYSDTGRYDISPMLTENMEKKDLYAFCSVCGGMVIIDSHSNKTVCPRCNSIIYSGQ